MRRALAAAQLAAAGPYSAAVFKRRLGVVGNVPRAPEQRFLALELADVVRGYGPTHPLDKAALAGRMSPTAAAEALLRRSRRTARRGAAARHPGIQP